MVRRTLLFGTLLCLLAIPLEAQDPTLIVENARVIVGDGTVLDRGTVVVAGERIISVSDESVEAPDARRIDAEGKTVLPGLIDTHVHLTIGPGVEDEPSLASFIESEVPEILMDFLRHGVTTLRSPGDYWPAVGELRDRLATGEMRGPRLLVAGPVLTAVGAHPATTICDPDNAFCRQRLTREVAGPEEAREAVARLAEEGVDFVKLVSDGGLGPQISVETVAAIVEQAHREGLEAVGHVAGTEYIRREVTAGLDGLVHSRMSATTFPEALASLLVKEGVPVTSTLSLTLLLGPGMDVLGVADTVEAILDGRSGSRRAWIEGISRDVTVLRQQGVQVALGSDWCPCLGGMIPGGTSDLPLALDAGTITHTEMELLSWGGMAPTEVLEAATADAARAIGLGHVLGTLEPGKLANLIVVDGNPLQDLSALQNVWLVIRGGEVVIED